MYLGGLDVRALGCEVIVPLKQIFVYGDLIIIYPKPYSIYLRGTIGCRFRGRVGPKVISKDLQNEANGRLAKSWVFRV